MEPTVPSKFFLCSRMPLLLLDSGVVVTHFLRKTCHRSVMSACLRTSSLPVNESTWSELGRMISRTQEPGSFDLVPKYLSLSSYTILPPILSLTYSRVRFLDNSPTVANMKNQSLSSQIFLQTSCNTHIGESSCSSFYPRRQGSQQQCLHVKKWKKNIQRATNLMEPINQSSSKWVNKSFVQRIN